MGKRAKNREDRQKLRERLGHLTVKQIIGDYKEFIRVGPSIVAKNLKTVLIDEDFKLVKRFPDEVLIIIDTLGGNLSFKDMAKIKSAVGDGIRNMS